MKTANLKAIIYFVLTSVFLSINTTAQQTNINGPAGSGSFGTQVVALPNGNIVVTDPTYSIPSGASSVGAIYLYDGSNGNLISTVTGSTENDRVGIGGVTVLTNSNYVVRSRFWSGTAVAAGAVTFGNGTTGTTGIVSSTNSLVGSSPNDQIGSGSLVPLSNGNYVVGSPSWNGTAVGAGAVTFGNGTSGISGVVSSSNSLIGSTANDFVGLGGIFPLPNGNYVVNSRDWDGAAVNVGAVTFGNGTTGISGVVSSSNSLIGSTANDRIGSGGVIILTNGNYVVRSTQWNNTETSVGAVTFASGTTGISGFVSPANSLVGSIQNDRVGIGGIYPLPNGNYVVNSTNWDGAAEDVGAVTFGNGTTGISGVVSPANSLVGSTEDDQVGSTPITVLTNGNYVVTSSQWNGTAADVGAVTFGDGTNGISGVVSPANSLVGSTAADQVGFTLSGSGAVVPLTNGNYVVVSQRWNGTAVDVGAVTFANGTSGISGVVSPANSLVGSTANDRVGSGNVIPLTNGNYVVISPNWNSNVSFAGAVTFGNGTTGVTGVVSSSNSLVGSTATDQVGNSGVTPLTNGNYVVSSRSWNGTANDVGAVTFANGTSGISGVVSPANSLVGSTLFDQVGDSVTALTNGNYVVGSPFWDGTSANIGAVTFGDGTTGITGVVSSVKFFGRFNSR